MRQSFWKALPAAPLMALAIPASAASVSLTPSQDSMIFATSAGVDTNRASGKGPALFAGADGSSNIKRSLLEFDVSGIPLNATITGVTLTLYLAQIAGSGGGSTSSPLTARTFELHELQQAWTTGSSGSPTSASVGGTGQGFTRTAGDTTWDYASFDPANLSAGKWTDGSSALHGGNFDPTASATSTFTAFSVLNTPFTWSSPGLVADVQAWVDGAATNNGWLLKGDSTLESSATSFLGFWSLDGALANSNIGIAPHLDITFTTAAPAPLPAAMALFPVGLGWAWLFGRRRSAGRPGGE